MKKMTFWTFISDILFFNFMAKVHCLLYLYYIPNLIHTGAFKFLQMKCNNYEKQSIEEKSTNFDAENGILFQQLISEYF